LRSDAPDGFLVNSFAGDDDLACKDYVRERLGLPAFKPNGGGHRASAAHDNKPTRRLVAEYDYTDSTGKLLYQVLRYEPKGFSQRRPDGKGGWIWKLEDRRVLYRLPELLKYPDATVFICEGEKDADRVAELGLCATNVARDNSDKWTEDCIKALAGRDVVILQDNDDPGFKRATNRAKALHGIANSIRVVLLPDLPVKGDVSKWLDADPSRDRDKLVEACFAVPEWSPLPPLPFINMADWDKEPIPEQEWVVKNRIPAHQTTLFSGEGAAGKSTIQLQLLAAHALAAADVDAGKVPSRDWLGSLPEPGPGIYFEAEDGDKILHRRLAAIASYYGVTFADLIKGGLHLLSFVGQDAVLATASRNGKIEPTQLYNQLLQAAGDIKPKMIAIASSANVFAGNEVDRSQVQQFVGLLTRVAIVARGAVNLLSHPSLTGIDKDTGLSGNTQWHNAVRARFYLKGVKPQTGEEPDNDLRELVFKKNNYGPLSETIALRWKEGLFLSVGGASNLEKLAAEQTADRVFLILLTRFNRQRRNVSDRPTSNGYAPTTFAKEDEAKAARLSKDALADAMRRLFAADKIHVEIYGKPSNTHSKLALGPHLEQQQ
jgi:RecA-family ATPase